MATLDQEILPTHFVKIPTNFKRVSGGEGVTPLPHTPVGDNLGSNPLKKLLILTCAFKNLVTPVTFVSYKRLCII